MTHYPFSENAAAPLRPFHRFGPLLRGDICRFTIWCRDADTLDLYLYENPTDLRPLREIHLNPDDHRFGDVWSVEAPGVRPGMAYAWRVGREGDDRFSENQLVLDPYAPAVAGAPEWGQSLVRQPGAPLHSGPAFPKALVVEDAFDWGGDVSPDIAWEDMVVYEAHVRGMTAGPGAHVEHPGTYEGLREKIPHLEHLGVTSVELMPMFEFDEMEYYHHNDARSNLRNYWGYSTLAFFAPNGRYAAAGNRGGQVAEFKRLVRDLHAAGMEVILDVVYNHTAENGQGSTAYNFKVLGEETYYILDDEGGHSNQTGCGNTVNANHPVTRQFIVDNLRHWVLEYHVDGFRFDLASILCRGRDGELLDHPPLIEEIDEDPILHNVKMIAEAWDPAGAYQVGSFPSPHWPEWNGRYRDDIRRFWSGEPGMLSAFATRILGSEDLYAGQPLGSRKSVNFVCCHDGFTLRDLVSYREKHNQANLEDNRDGENHNYSANCGHEGTTTDAKVNELRLQMQKNFLATLFISRGIPLFPAGDELGRTQRGNNNAYCQDNELSWLDWNLDADQENLLEFTRKLIQLRRELPVLRFPGLVNDAPPDIAGRRVHWIGPDHREPDWPHDQAIGLHLRGDPESTGGNRHHHDVLVFFNASPESVRFTIPETDTCKWKPRLHTTRKRAHRGHMGTHIQTPAHSVMIYSGKNKK